jgi:hypothetical protein
VKARERYISRVDVSSGMMWPGERVVDWLSMECLWGYWLYGRHWRTRLVIHLTRPPLPGGASGQQAC